jgi:hypothetical protein
MQKPPIHAANALVVLTDLGAPARLLRHAELVGEAAEGLLRAVAALNIVVDGEIVAAGAALHDAGKIVHPAELSAPGHLHEAAGERLLLGHGVAPAIARVCRSHAQWASMDPSFEELLVALADKLWKGVRHGELEERVIAEAATRLGAPRWEVFVALDAAFESIAASGDARLARSVVGG